MFIVTSYVIIAKNTPYNSWPSAHFPVGLIWQFSGVKWNMDTEHWTAFVSLTLCSCQDHCHNLCCTWISPRTSNPWVESGLVHCPVPRYSVPQQSTTTTVFSELQKKNLFSKDIQRHIVMIWYKFIVRYEPKSLLWVLLVKVFAS